MAKETEKNNEGATIRISFGQLRPADFVGNGKFIAGKEKPKVIDFAEETMKTNK